MKKIIALLVVFALFAGSVFAVDLGGAVNGSVTLFQGSSADGDDDITASAAMNRIRIEGAGQTDDGVFGGWLRKEAGEDGANGLVWWKPIDMLKIIIGGNPDGHWGKEGITGWMFSQTAYDSDVTNNSANIWGGSGMYGWNYVTRNAFFAGDGHNALRLEFTPIDILAVKVAIPFFDGGKFEDILKNSIAQVDLNFAFANIALTYSGKAMYFQPGDGATIFGYVGLPLGILGLDVGVGMQLQNEDETSNPIFAGLGLKVGLSDLFQIRFRTVASFGGEEGEPFMLTADLNPYLTLSDSLRVGLTLGFAMSSYEDSDSNLTGFNVNPYIEVGQEWGPKFLAGFMLSSDGTKDAKDNGIIKWAVGIGIQSSF
jgi:hypothetical protein